MASYAKDDDERVYDFALDGSQEGTDIQHAVGEGIFDLLDIFTIACVEQGFEVFEDVFNEYVGGEVRADELNVVEGGGLDDAF